MSQNSESELFFALLRINAAQILRYSGIAGAKPSVLDAFTDMIARYLLLLGTTTRQLTESSGRTQSELEDARCALEHVGFLIPGTSFSQDASDDTRAVDGFIAWATSAATEEMRRVAGMEKQSNIGVDLDVPDAGIGGIDGAEPRKTVERKMDWMSSVKVKEGRTEDGERERWRGTAMGEGKKPTEVVIEGGDELSERVREAIEVENQNSRKIAEMRVQLAEIRRTFSEAGSP